MMTYKQLKEFCEKKNIRFEVNTLYSKPWFSPYDLEEHRTILGFEIGMNNIACHKGNSEWQWTWFETIGCPEKLEDDTQFWFRERYSQINGRSYKGWREGWNAENTIMSRMKNV